MKNLLSLFLGAIIFLFACNTRSSSTSFSADSFTFNVYTPNAERPNIKEFQVIISKGERNDTIYINDSNAFKLFFNTSTQKLEYEKVNELNNEVKFYSITDMANGFIGEPVLSIKNIEGEKIEYAIYGEANLLDNTILKDQRSAKSKEDGNSYKILGDSSILDNTSIDIKTGGGSGKIILGDSSILDNTIAINSDGSIILGDSSILDNTISINNDGSIILGDSSILDNTIAEIVDALKDENPELNEIDNATLTEYVKEVIDMKINRYNHFAVNLNYPVYISVKYEADGNSYFQLNYAPTDSIHSATIGNENKMYRSSTKFTNIVR